MALARTALLIALTGLGWGLLALFSKLLFAAEPRVFDGVTVAIARAAWTLPIFAVVLPLAWRLERPVISARRWLVFAGLGVCFAGFFVLFSLASQATSVAHIAFLVGLAPPVNGALAALLLRAPLDLVRRVALAIGILGVALLALTKSSSGASLLGDLDMIGWLLDFGIYSLLLRVASVRYSVVFVTALVGAIGTAGLTAGGIAAGAGAAIGHVADTPAIGAWFFVGVVVLATLTAPLAFAAAIRQSGVAVATAGAEYGAVGVGAISSVAILHERWQPLLGVAGVLILASLALTFAPADLFARRAGRARPIA